MKQTNMRMLALCAALCLCVATAAPAYAESTRQTPRTSFVETLLDIPVLGDILRFSVPQLPERCLSRKAGIARCCLYIFGCSVKSKKPGRAGFEPALLRLWCPMITLRSF